MDGPWGHGVFSDTAKNRFLAAGAQYEQKMTLSQTILSNICVFFGLIVASIEQTEKILSLITLEHVLG